MASKCELALNRFVASARDLFAQETDVATRWEKLGPLLRELLADPDLEVAVIDLSRPRVLDRIAACVPVVWPAGIPVNR